MAKSNQAVTMTEELELVMEGSAAAEPVTHEAPGGGEGGGGDWAAAGRGNPKKDERKRTRRAGARRWRRKGGIGGTEKAVALGRSPGGRSLGLRGSREPRVT